MWPRSTGELIQEQCELAARVPTAWSAPPMAAIGACSICFAGGLADRATPGNRAFAAAAVLRGKHIQSEATVDGRAEAPYLPGLLALREGPCLERAVRALPALPDVLLVNATGRDHPRRAGLALHLGALLNLPTVGVTNRPLLAHGSWPEDIRGATAPLVLDGGQVGAWVRTRRHARPIATHPGWRTDIESAIEVVLRASRGHRTPEPLRRARQLARLARAHAF